MSLADLVDELSPPDIIYLKPPMIIITTETVPTMIERMLITFLRRFFTFLFDVTALDALPEALHSTLESDSLSKRHESVAKSACDTAMGMTRENVISVNADTSNNLNLFMLYLNYLKKLEFNTNVTMNLLNMAIVSPISA